MKVTKFIQSTEPGFSLKSQFDTEIKLDAEDDYGENYCKYEELCKDKNIMTPFVQAITKNKHLFRNKIVLDINCGLGILTVLAAKAGASHVFAIEPTSLSTYTQQIVKDNGVSDVVTVIRSSIEDLVLPCEQVDIIVCQWMGYFMLFDGMVDQVIMARDKFLKKDGLIIPDRGVLFLASIEDEEFRNKKSDFWYTSKKSQKIRKKVYGVDMDCMTKWVLTEPPIEKIKTTQVNSESCAVFELDLYKASLGDLDFSNAFKLKLTRNDYVHGIVGWFEVYFSSGHLPIRLSTAPFSKITCWKQTIFYFKETLTCHKDEYIRGSIALKRHGKDIDIMISAHLENVVHKWDILSYYKMN